MNVRPARSNDLDAIRKITRIAFPEEERQANAELVVDLFSDLTEPPIKAFVAEKEGETIGYAFFSPIFFKVRTAIRAAILSPLAVTPRHPSQGAGTGLVKAGIEALSEDGFDVLLVYGDPEYYGRFGFKEEIARPFVPPYRLEYPFGWQGMRLGEFAGGAEKPLRFACVSALSKPELW